MWRKVSIVGAVALALAGSAAADPQVEATAPAEDRLVAMHRHLGTVQRMHQGVIDGELDAARKAASELAEPRTIADIPDAWKPWLDVMRDSASRAAGDWSPTNAARTVTEVGRSCGGCHAFTAGGPPEPTGEPPEGVARHAWAADAMWVALVRGDTGGFRAAGDVMRSAELSKGPKKDRARVRELATRATHAKSRAIMADTYGELLGMCADCHRR